MSTLGARIRNVRNGLQLNQIEFADKLNLSAGFIRDIESDLKVPSERTLELMCLKLHANKDYLLNGNGTIFSDMDEKVAKALMEYNEMPPILQEYVFGIITYGKNLGQAYSKVESREKEISKMDNGDNAN